MLSRENMSASFFVSGWIQEGQPLLALNRVEQSMPLGYVSSVWGVVPGEKADEALRGLLPWRQGESWESPLPYLCENQRICLAERLKTLQENCPKDSLGWAAYEAWHHDIATYEQTEREVPQPARTLWLMAMAWEAGGAGAVQIIKQEVVTGKAMPLLLEKQGMQACSLPKTDMRWLWKGVPFAQTDEKLGLRRGLPWQAEQIAGELAQEVEAQCCSTQGRKRLQKGLEQLEKQLPALQSSLDVARKTLEDRPPLPDCLELNWPWQPDSEGLRLAVREALGQAGVEGALQAFTVRMLVWQTPNGSPLGDVQLQRLCTIAHPAWGCCTVLPPLSQTFAEGWGDGHLTWQMEQTVFLPGQQEGILCSLLLQGKRQVRLNRWYPAAQIRVMRSVPTLTLWPSVQFRKGDWKTFVLQVQQEADLKVSLRRRKGWKTQGGRGETVTITDRYPQGLLLEDGEGLLGLLPNALPIMEATQGRSAVIGLDLGASSLAVSLTVDGEEIPLDAAALQRTLVAGSEPVLPLLPMETHSGRLPVNLWTSGKGTTPFVDGRILTAQTMQERSAELRTGCVSNLKWRVDPDRDRYLLLLFKQAMTMALLSARMHGAETVSWCWADSESLGLGARTHLWELFCESGRAVCQETGMTLNEVRPFTRGSASKALLAGLRKGQPELGGNLLAVDVGSWEVNFRLWLRGMETPAASFTTIQGTWFLVLETLRNHPWLVTETASAPEMEDLLSAFAQQSNVQADSLFSVQVDAFLQKHSRGLAQAMEAKRMMGETTPLESLLLLVFSFLFAEAGLLLAHGILDPTVSHRMPPALPVVWAGGGSQLLGWLGARGYQSLAAFLTVSTSNERAMPKAQLVQSQRPGMEIAMGLQEMDDLSATMPVEVKANSSLKGNRSLEEMLRIHMQRFGQLFPQSANLLFPQWYDPMGILNTAGQQELREMAAQEAGQFETMIALGNAFAQVLAAISDPPVPENAQLE